VYFYYCKTFINQVLDIDNGYGTLQLVNESLVFVLYYITVLECKVKDHKYA